MNKRVIDEIEENNEAKTNSILVILILIFCFILGFTIIFSIKYNNKLKLLSSKNIIQLNNQNIKASIINNGLVDATISDNMFEIDKKQELIFENINIIEVKSLTSEENKMIFDINYNILENEFNINDSPTNKSEVLVRFSYSFDKENWTYINNVITTNVSNMSSLIGNNYDIAGQITNLNVSTNYELILKENEKLKMYWRSETIFKKINDKNKPRKFKAEFTIDHKS